VLFADIDARLACVVEQDLVELAASNLLSVTPVRRQIPWTVDGSSDSPI